MVQKHKGCSWRRNPIYFSPGDNLSPGITDIASSWFQAGHSVSPHQLNESSLVMPPQGGTARPEVSRSLKNDSRSAGSWLKQNARLQSIMASVLALTHPGQYKAGLDMLKTFKQNPGLLREPAAISRVLDCWFTPFSGVSVICNRETPRHKDVSGRFDWYDVLVTLGTHSEIKFGLPGLRTTLMYSPRTVVALCGRIITHSVESNEDGDRACFAWFMREDVRKYLGIDPGGTSTGEGVLGSSSSLSYS